MTFKEIFSYMSKGIKDADMIYHLIEWYNTDEESLTLDDLDLLTALAQHDVHYSECRMCSNNGYKVHPDQWESFQGVFEGNDFETIDIEIEGVTVPLCVDCHGDLIRIIKS